MVAQPPYQCGFEHFLRFQRRQHPKFPNYRASCKTLRRI
jgi:hypothetical protein